MTKRKRSTAHFGLLCATVLTFGSDVAPALATHDVDYTDMSLEQLMAIPVRAASGFDQDASRAPGSVTIITKREIEDFGYRTLAEVLSSVAGVYTSYDRSYESLGMRGFSPPGDYNGRILLQVNGSRVNDSVYESAFLGSNFLVDLDLIDRVELIRGPSSSLYGTNAFFGVVNVITVEPSDSSARSAALSAGTLGTAQGRFSFGRGEREKNSLIVSGTVTTQRGADVYLPQYDAAETNGGVAEDIDGSSLGALFLRGRYSKWSIQFAYVDREKERPTAAYETFFNVSGASDIDRSAAIDLGWSDSVGRGLDVSAGLSYNHYTYTGTWPYDYAEDPATAAEIDFDRDEARSQRIGFESRLTSTRWRRHTVSIGFEARSAYEIRQAYFSRGEPIFDRNDSRLDLGVHVLDEWNIGSRAILSTGLRHDSMQPDSESRLSPRIAMIVLPREGSTLKFVYGEAFRAPNAYERFYADDGLSTKVNPGLSAERIRSYELSGDHWWSKSLTTRISVFRFDVEDLITQELDEGDGLLYFDNVGAAEATGIEGTMSLQTASGIRGRMSLTYSDALDAGTGARLSNAPALLGKLHLSVPLVHRRLNAAVEVQHIGERLSVERETVPAVTLTNLTILSRSGYGPIDLSMGVYNLFDIEYSAPTSAAIEGGVVEQDGRTLRLRAIYHF